MSSANFDVIVIGAGIEGTCTAFYLAKQGQSVLLLEQFDLPHSNGSSHGESRIIRTAYSESFFADMMKDAYELWDEIEKLAETQLIIKTGLLGIAHDPCHAFDNVIRNMKKFSSENLEILDSQARKQRFPMICYPDAYRAFFDKSGGIILADKSVETIRILYQKFGGNVLTNCKVTNIEAGETVTVQTLKGAYQADSVVICAGSWTNMVLSPLNLKLPIQPERVRVFYWKEKVPGSYNLKNGFSPFIDYNTNDHHIIYGIPSVNNSQEIKVSIHYGIPTDPDSTSDEKFESFDEDIKIMTDFVQTHFPGLVPEPNVTETCIYSASPDECFILDSHPQYKNIIFGAGFTGTGFKFGPLVGKILGKMSMREQPSYDMSPFSISRF